MSTSRLAPRWNDRFLGRRVAYPARCQRCDCVLWMHCIFYVLHSIFYTLLPVIRGSSGPDLQRGGALSGEGHRLRGLWQETNLLTGKRCVSCLGRVEERATTRPCPMPEVGHIVKVRSNTSLPLIGTNCADLGRPARIGRARQVGRWEGQARGKQGGKHNTQARRKAGKQAGKQTGKQASRQAGKQASKRASQSVGQSVGQ